MMITLVRITLAMVTLVMFTLVINSLLYFILVISLWYNTDKILLKFKSMKNIFIIGLIVLTSSLITCVPT